MSTSDPPTTDQSPSGGTQRRATDSGSELIHQCRPTDVTAVEISGTDLETTAPSYLRELKAQFIAHDRQPSRIVVSATFDTACSIETQHEVDRLRDYVRTASVLGAGQLVVEIDDVEAPDRVEPALAALSEQAERNGIALSITGTDDVTVAI